MTGRRSSPSSEGSAAAHRRADIEARIALVQLEGMGPARARWLLAEHDPAEVVARLRRGDFPVPHEEAPPGLKQRHLDQWHSDLAALDSAALYQRQVDKGWTILAPADPRWPVSEDPEPPLLLFCEGDVDLLNHRPAVAAVGTRRCTSVGRTVAYRLGADLAAGGVAVLSGLALGVDAAAHQGALDNGGPAIGVVGTGLDVTYPRSNRRLWSEVGQSGLLISEYPAGTQPARWHFPARNRILASLSTGVVIVESHGRGGSLITADEAIERGRMVMAVPGSVVNPAADGVNGLIVDGAIPVRNGQDVMEAIGFRQPEPIRSQQLEMSVGPESDEPIIGPSSELASFVRGEVMAGSVSLDQLALGSGRSLVEIVRVVHEMVEQGDMVLEGATVSLAGSLPPTDDPPEKSR